MSIKIYKGVRFTKNNITDVIDIIEKWRPTAMKMMVDDLTNHALQYTHLEARQMNDILLEHLRNNDDRLITDNIEISIIRTVLWKNVPRHPTWS